MYYSSLYHPYNPTYHDLVPDPLSVCQRISELQTLDHYKKLAQSEAIVKASQEAIVRQNYTRSLLINSKIESDLYQKMYGNSIDAVKFNVAQTNVEYNYLKKLQELRREREMLESSGRVNIFPEIVEQKLRNNDERYMSDDELVNYYRSGARGKDYHYEVYKHLQNNKNNVDKDVSKFDASYKTDRIHNKINKQSGQRGSNSNDIKKLAEQLQRSYVDELDQNTTNRYGNIQDLVVQKSRKQIERGATIDVLRNLKEDSSLANTFYDSPKKKKTNNLNKTAVLDSKKSITKVNKKLNSTFITAYNITFNSAIIESSMQKINNRLKVSNIVYKDSKLRHARHEGQHLFNTFQSELKGRKEVKDKINNNPSVLKKHNMVVASR